MTDLAGTFSGVRFYRHSGKVPPGAGAMALIIAVLVGIIAGGVFGFLELLIHTFAGGKLLLLLIGLGIVVLGLLLGWAPVVVLRRMHGRSNPAAMLVAAIAWAAGLYSAWVLWICALALYGNGNFPVEFFWHPIALWQTICELDQDGVWTIGKDTPSGWFLALLWLIEAGTLLVLAWVAARKTINAKVYCEQCHRWGEKKTLMQITGLPTDQLKKDLLAGDVSSLAKGQKYDFDASAWSDVVLEGCSQCDSLQTLTVDATTEIASRKGEKSKKTRVLVKRLLLSPEQILLVLQAAATLTAPEVREPSPEGNPPEPSPEAPAPEQ